MAAPALSVENRLGPYRLLHIIGEGGMGSVFLGVDEGLDRRVAIKVLRADAGGDSSAAAKRFLREARSAARINHTNVVTIYAVGRQPGGNGDGRPYIVMEYVEGGSLAERVRHEGPLEWREATRAIADALAGLAAAHQRGVVHRDIKPANLMCGRDGTGRDVTKLVDFGLARVLAGPRDVDLTYPGAFVGSPSYCSPEQAAGGEVDGRSDLYSLAATWYALLTGQPPFVAEDPAEVLERHLRDAFPDVRLLAPATPQEVVRVIAKASRKKAAERYQSAGEMREAVEQLLRMPSDVPSGSRILRRARRKTPDYRPGMGRCEDSLVELESRLEEARRRADGSTQLDTLRRLHGLYAQLDRRDEATRTFREALVLHVRMNAPLGREN